MDAPGETEHAWLTESFRQPRLAKDPMARINPHPDAASRRRYIQFATEAARFFKGRKPVRFGGGHWKI